MNSLSELLGGFIVVASWLAGIVLAKGFWSTAFTIILPPYAWYLVVEHLMLFNGFVN